MESNRPDLGESGQTEPETVSAPVEQSSVFHRSWQRIFGDFNFREELLGPVLVNLTTALILFLSVATFRDSIYRLLLPRPRVANFPISVTAEAYNTNSGEQQAEIYIMNLEAKSFSEADLRALLSKDRPTGASAPDAAIEVTWDRAVGEMSLTEDSFNEGKGQLALTPSGTARKAYIRILDINRRALMRVIVRTNYKEPISRGSAALPFQIRTPGE